MSGSKEIEAVFNNIASSYGQNGELMKYWDTVDDVICESEKQIFANENVVTNYTQWVSLSPKYSKWKSRNYPGKKILERTGVMKAAASIKNAAGHYFMKDYLFTISGIDPFVVPYAMYHQNGTSKMPRRNFFHLFAEPVKKILTGLRMFMVKDINNKLHGSDPAWEYEKMFKGQRITGVPGL